MSIGCGLNDTLINFDGSSTNSEIPDVYLNTILDNLLSQKKAAYDTPSGYYTATVNNGGGSPMHMRTNNGFLITMKSAAVAAAWNNN